MDCFFEAGKIVVDERLPPGWFVVQGTNRTWTAHNGDSLMWGRIDETGAAKVEGVCEFEERADA